MFAPEDFLTLARRLLDEGNDEATLRTVISRAYYSAFLAFRLKLEAHGLRHKKFWTSVQELDPALGELGQRFRTIRNAAGYGDEVPDLAEESLRAIRRAELILSRCR